MENLPLKQIIEGAIMASEHPLTLDRVMQLFEGNAPEREEVRAVIKEIEADCAGRGYELKRVASGYRFQIKSEYSEWVSRLWKETPPRYSRALLETLALVAYKQPITRGDIEEIRGVGVSTNIMRTLLERGWVKVVGHRDVPGHPALYATTKNFLDYFNLNSLDELPSLSEIRDLTPGTEELSIEEERIEIRSLKIDPADKNEVAEFEDADLDEVSQQVNSIQENIRSFLAPELEAIEDSTWQEESVETELEEGGSERRAEELIKERAANVTPITSAKSPREDLEG